MSEWRLAMGLSFNVLNYASYDDNFYMLVYEHIFYLRYLDLEIELVWKTNMTRDLESQVGEMLLDHECAMLEAQ